MKDAEDEAFDELARKQGMWGGGFPAKRAMAAAKLQDGKCRLCVDGCIACDARVMKLYNAPRNSMIVLENGLELKFHHIDGMYSVCTDEEGNVYHIGASEEVTVKEKKDES